MASGEFDQVVASMAAVVDELLDADVSSLEEASLVAALRAFEVQRRRLEAVEHRLIKQVNDTHLPASCAMRTAAGVLAKALLIDQAEARRREERALDCGPRTTLTGEPLEPVLPRVAAAVAEGVVSAAQLDVIVEAMAKIPDTAPAEAWPVAERVLVEAARHEPPRLLRRTAHELITRLTPEDDELAERRRERDRGFTLSPRADGWSRVSGRLTPQLTAQLQAVLDALAAPRPAQDGTPDPRTAAQRRHDGLGEAIDWVLRSEQVPDCGGTPVTVLATTSMAELARAAGQPAGGARGGGVDLSDLVAGSGLELTQLLAEMSSGLATLAHGQLISARSLLGWACEAEVVPVVFNQSGGVLDYGRTRRLASPGQRAALAARDGGCSFPGCDRPPAWCQAHHLIEWIAGGETNLNNLCLVCSYHHRTFAHAGWQAVMRDGVPWWIPPAWEDPDRTPRRNTVHHLAKIEFRRPAAA